MSKVTLTTDSKAFFIDLVSDAPNWSGMPLFGGNISDSNENKGYLTALKKAGLVTSFVEEGCCWVSFTDAGKELASELGYEGWCD